MASIPATLADSNPDDARAHAQFTASLRIVGTMTVGGIFYGFMTTTAALCAHSLVQTRQSRSRRHLAFLLVYICVLWAAGTVLIGGMSGTCIDTFVVHASTSLESPYMQDPALGGSTMIASIAYWVILMLSDGMMIWRFKVIWATSSLSRYLIAVPIAFYLSASILGFFTYVIFGTRPLIAGPSNVNPRLIAAMMMSSFILNIYITGLIAGRLFLYRRRFKVNWGSPDEKHYTSIGPILLESYLPLTIFTIPYFVTYLLNNPALFMTTAILSQMQISAPLMVMLRVSRGVSWDFSPSPQSVEDTINRALEAHDLWAVHAELVHDHASSLHQASIVRLPPPLTALLSLKRVLSPWGMASTSSTPADSDPDQARAQAAFTASLRVIGSMTVGGTFYGFMSTAAALCAHSLIQTRQSRSQRSLAFLLVYVGTLWLAGTALVAGMSGITIETYVIHASTSLESPYMQDLAPGGFTTASDIPFWIICMLSDGMMVWRFKVVWSMSRFYRYLMVGPVILWSGTSILGFFAFIIYSNLPVTANNCTINLYLVAGMFVSSFCLNVYVTALIAGRLYLYRRRFKENWGSPDSRHYSSMGVILIESYVPLTICTIPLLATYLTNHPAEFMVALILGEMQIIAPLVVMIRVSRGVAWDSSTAPQSLEDAVDRMIEAHELRTAQEVV
ncbi:hypothetical protein CONPUDRAFT_162090 [Coniophora puteana RWD-64-598 SS2]|uniref:Uncharacterized protein n=1 Tax=Coniophora puteana (strain RWD-64-598) TaxID=741705 RepID=A0A5M3N043_CONPW|nr:uncharacterized protein CONPUDRAFT_162090 [Coniophora puteana RWD-64-598 SS2]EIW84742.1 hypothetical protein CONPUDRAFT_162090 [Coniophora puteana RWD-64-598 SS2]